MVKIQKHGKKHLICLAVRSGPVPGHASVPGHALIQGHGNLIDVEDPMPRQFYQHDDGDDDDDFEQTRPQAGPQALP